MEVITSGGCTTGATIHAHAMRLGLTTEQLSRALLQHGAWELAAWAHAEEKADPGSVWYTGDAPEWLADHLPQREGF